MKVFPTLALLIFLTYSSFAKPMPDILLRVKVNTIRATCVDKVPNCHTVIKEIIERVHKKELGKAPKIARCSGNQNGDVLVVTYLLPAGTEPNYKAIGKALTKWNLMHDGMYAGEWEHVPISLNAPLGVL